MRHERYSTNHVDGSRVGVSVLHRVGRALGAVLALGLFAGGLSTLAAACGGTNAGSTGTTGGCENGIETDAGACVAQCDPSKCIAGNTCVGNACQLTCTAHTDCNAGTQDCTPATPDYPSICPDGKACDFTQCDGKECALDTAACNGDPACVIGKCPDSAACTVPGCAKDQCATQPINVCASTGRAAQGATCPFGMECDTLTACPDGKACDYTQCGGAVCTKDDAACGGDAACTIGKCPDKAPCTVPACAADQCKPMHCRTSGEGDAFAYCSINDCKDDSSCPGGFKCDVIHDPHQICGSNPPKGNNNACGKTTEPCIEPADFAKDGATFIEGSVCLLHNACTRRVDCDPCATDLDCSQVPGLICAPLGPSADKRCTYPCGTDKDCGPSYRCMDKVCAPRFAGGCIGTGGFCEPCRNDEDCGSVGTHKACIEVDGLTHERACLDLSFPDACTKTSDCPKSPGGKTAICGTELGAGPGDALYNKCYLPYNGNTNKFSCY